MNRQMVKQGNSSPVLGLGLSLLVISNYMLVEQVTGTVIMGD